MSTRRLMLPLIALLATAAAPVPVPRRVVSLNLCADQYLLALADPGQIAALTQFSRDPEMSAAAAAARGVPQTRGTAEDVLMLTADLVIASPYSRTETVAALKQRGLRSIDLAPADSYSQIVAQVRQVAGAVGHVARGEALIARMDAALARVPRGAGRGRVAAYYQRRGFLTGTGTLIDDLMARVGLVNLAAKLDRPPLSRVSLEEMVAARPDYLILETGAAKVADQGTEMLAHPVLKGIPRLWLPQAWTVCGGPAYVLAAASLARQMAARR